VVDPRHVPARPGATRIVVQPHAGLAGAHLVEELYALPYSPRVLVAL
jgi:hypothetical protein